MASSDWTPDSWRSKPIKQAAEYPNAAVLRSSVAELASLPPLVHPSEIEALKAQLRDAARGRAFVLQGGDCAELFDYCRQPAIESKIKLLLQMSVVLIWGTSRRVVRIGRMAGQYAKPRSSPTERVVVDGGQSREVPAFRGDILNGHAVADRALDPRRLVRAYHHSAATLNFVRAAVASGIADLRHPFDWGLGHVRDPVLKDKYSAIARSIQQTLRFLHVINARPDELDTVEIFSSHEGLLLEYEQALTRHLEKPAPHSFGRSGGSTGSTGSTGSSASSDDDASSTGSGSRRSSARADVDAASRPREYYDTSAHFLWIGDRTRQLDHAHVDFFRGVANPIGVKVGPSTPAADLLALLRALNPRREPGKVTLITRYGAARVAELLPLHIRAVEDSEHRGTVVWQCDPMHGNTIVATTSSGAVVKTRRFGDIYAELDAALRVHRLHGSQLGGLHLELTGDAVTECLGGGEDLGEDDLATNYTSFCDPRLNEKQALELAFLVADHFAKAG